MEILQMKQMMIDDEPFVAKRLRICDLPDCYYKSRLQAMVDDDTSSLWVVGKPGDPVVGDWAAYIGHPMPSSWLPAYREAMMPYVAQGLIHPEGICRYGDKLEREVAEVLFPEYATLKYRY